MRFRVLGPVEIEADGGLVGLPRRRERCLLGVLLLELNRVVSVDRLAELLWDGEPPDRARRSIHGHVSHIRATLAQAGAAEHDVAVVSTGSGYRLSAEPHAVDAHRFRALIGEARMVADPADRADRLRTALELWRGPPLDDAASGWVRDRLCTDLNELRLSATEDLFSDSLALGQERVVLPDLARISAEHPGRESLVALHMRALHQAGRTADALDVYARARSYLVEQLGLDPGSALRDLHQAILRDEHPPTPAAGMPGPTERSASAAAPDESDPASARSASTQVGVVVPRQLPADVPCFTGRAEHLQQLDSLLLDERDGQPSTVVISAVDGMAGVGKTALAVHWAHRMADRFPDGQLYINLRGHAPGPALRPVEALVTFLYALGVVTDRVPSDVDAAAGLYRSLVADRRMLVVLDNAVSPEQVRPLLPGGGGSVVVVTSRDQLGGLVARDGARRLNLDVLTVGEAQALLTAMLGAERSGRERGAVAALAEMCGHLPLALRIAAANLAAHPQHRVADYVAELRDRGRVAALAVPGDPQSRVSAAFDLSYTRLPDPAQRLFRLLALAPGPDVTAEAAAALAGTTPTHAGQLLETLASAHLAEEHAVGRYACHDLLRHYAADIVKREETEPERNAARARLYDYYLNTVDAAARLLYPEKLRLPLPKTETSATPVPERDHGQALAWLDDELSCLVAAVRDAQANGPRATAWLLADALRGYFILRRCYVDWLAAAEAALAAAETDGHVAGRAATQLSLGDAELYQERYPQAVEHYRQALSASQQLGSPKLQSSILNNLGEVYQRSGWPREAAEIYTQALALNRQATPYRPNGLQLGNLGTAYRALGQLDKAADYHAQALAIHRQTSNRAMEAVALRELGETYHALGRFNEALHHLTEALALHRLVGDRGSEAEAQRCLAGVHRDTGTAALQPAHAALAIAREVGERLLETDTLNTLATIHHRLGQHQQAIDYHQVALQLAHDLDIGRSRAEALIGLADSYRSIGDHEQAHSLLEQTVTITRERGFRLLEGQALQALSGLHLAEGEVDRAIRLGEQALAIHHQTGHWLGQARTHVVLSRARQCAGDAEGACDHVRRARALFTDIGTREADEITDERSADPPPIV